LFVGTLFLCLHLVFQKMTKIANFSPSFVFHQKAIKWTKFCKAEPLIFCGKLTNQRFHNR